MKKLCTPSKTTFKDKIWCFPIHCEGGGWVGEGRKERMFKYKSNYYQKDLKNAREHFFKEELATEKVRNMPIPK